MAQIIGMQNNVGQETGEELGSVGEGEGLGGAGGPPQSPQELGATGTGGGNIGTGAVPMPGEDQFAGTPRAVEG